MTTGRFASHGAWVLGLALAAVSASAEGPPPASEDSEETRPQRGIFYPGAAFLFQMDEVTVVYPAAPRELLELHRWSAERRAQFLERHHGVRARVRADDAVSPEELRGNLLLLGWNNRLLGTEQAPRPFERTAQGFHFLGRWEGDPTADLLLYHRSPYNPEKFLVFWSRIDPERDRLMVLPRVGSDWAILRDFRVVRQGMFVPGRAWPPQRDPLSESDAMLDIGQALARRASHTTDHYVVYYDPQLTQPAELREIVERREAAFARAVQFLGGPPPTRRLQLYVYGDADTKQRETGVPEPAHSLPSRREIHALENFARSPSPHEEIHVLAYFRYGPCVLTTLYEGLALAADGMLGGVALDLRAAVLAERGAFPELPQLLDEEQARGLASEVRATAAGVFVAWLRGWVDEGAFGRAYRLWRGDVANLGRELGKPPEAIASAFRAHLQGLVAHHGRELRALDHEAEAQQRLLAGDYAGVARALEKVVELKPEDPQALFNLASALMRTREYARAEALFRRILELPLDDSRAYFASFTHYQLGRLYDVQGRREAALVEYRKVLELPDRHDAHRLAREAIARPVTQEELE